MTKEPTPIKVGDRFEDKDARNDGRVVEVREIVVSPLDGVTRYLVEVEVHPNNPSAVGNRSKLTGLTLRGRYRKVSR